MVHLEGDFELGVQLVDCRADFLFEIGRFGLGVAGVLVLREEKQVLRGIEGGVLSGALSVIIDERVLHYRAGPCLQVGGIFKLAAVRQRFQKGVLQQVIGILPIGGQFHREARQHALKIEQFLVKIRHCHILLLLFKMMPQR